MFVHTDRSVVQKGNSIIDRTDTVSFFKDFVTKLMTVCPTSRVRAENRDAGREDKAFNSGQSGQHPIKGS